MVLVITSEKPLPNEAKQINDLFGAGLEILHLRKPTFTIDGYRGVLDQIDQQYHNRVMIHQFPELTMEYKLRGIHLQEQTRLDFDPSALKATILIYKNKGFSVTSSFHSKEDIIAYSSMDFEYVLLSPVFSSISKEGYQGKGFDVNDMNEFVVGMGGVNEHTLQAIHDLGYKGVGVLGGVWNTENSLQSFKTIYDAYTTIIS
ncbi:thiamine phosphate synthase [Aquimarina longa]|uniref:thiamine phosphate synthase n=1 Tax=Aquimarina longa TaxID=1080221 RepID=UPI000784D5F0|nr:thiamine phosphate synthase [Aquimarina longa]